MKAIIQVPDPNDLGAFIELPICLDYQQQVQRWLDRYQPLEQMLPDCQAAREMHPVERAVWTEGWDKVNSLTSSLDANSALSPSQLYRHLTPSAPYRGGAEPPRWPRRPPIRLNQLYWPTGASRWSIGAFLLANTEAQQLIASLAASEGESPTYEIVVRLVEDEAAGAPSRPKHTSHYDWASGFYVQVLDLRPISCEGESLWLLVTTDQRYWMNRWCYAEQFNYDTPVEIGAAIANALDGRLRSTIYAGSAPASTYGWVDWCEFRKHGAAMWQVDALAASAGMRVVNNYGWGWSIEAPTDSDAVLTTNARADWPRIAGGDIPSLFEVDPAVMLFDFVANEEGAATPFPHRVAVDSAGTATTTTDETADFDSLSGPDKYRVHLIQSSACAEDQDGTSLSSFCSYLAEALAARFRDWNDTRYDYTFAGIMPWLPCGYDDYVLFNLGNQAPPRLSASADGDGQIHLSESFDSMLWTRVVSLPRDFIPTSLSHRSATISRVGRIAPLIEFAITTGYTGTSGSGDTDVTVSVTRFYLGEHPDPTAAGLTIKAPADPDQSKTGTKGFAIRDSQGVWRAMSWMRVPDPL